ncbi:MAG: hypothetical protein LBU45_01005 [Azoarcus sp.]|jgi:hypothetical protein|nr:hypothetical protein [Azoarcus sp.]
MTWLTFEEENIAYMSYYGFISQIKDCTQMPDNLTVVKTVEKMAEICDVNLNTAQHNRIVSWVKDSVQMYCDSIPKPKKRIRRQKEK